MAKTKPVSADFSSLDPWVDGLVYAAKALGLSPSPERAKLAGDLAADGPVHTAVLTVAQSVGLTGRYTNTPLKKLPSILLPVIAQTSQNQIVVITAIRGQRAEITYVLEGETLTKAVSIDRLSAETKYPVLAVAPIERVTDPRVDDFLSPRSRSWFRQIFTGNLSVLFELTAASFFSSLIAIATSLFAMQVYDRVVPARSTTTLWVLASGVAVALVLDFLIRILRATITDQFGKKADLKLSAMFFARTLDIRSDARPRSPGSLIAQLRDLDQIREFLTSTTFSAAMDIPFVATFLFIIWMLGGSIVFVPLAAIPLVVIPSLLFQVPLARLSQEGMAESALRNAILMELMYRIEDIKALQAEPRFRRLWDETNAVNAAVSMKQRLLGTILVNWTQVVQQLAYAGVIIFGVYKVLDSTMSFGTLLACSILTSRAIAPLAQIAATFSRLQNALVGRRGLNELLKLPIDHAFDKDAYHRPVLAGNFIFENVLYSYGQQDKPALAITSLTIRAGERIAVLGRVGAGKSTFLRLAGGLALPMRGRILLDQTDLSLIDAADVRRDTGFLLQDSGLFYGTIRDNLLIANPRASDEEILEAMRISCADQLVVAQSHGLDLTIREGGAGLSGGQKQSLILARTILRAPSIVLLDEPTASLDEATERTVIENLKHWSKGRTMLIATHRYPVLDLVERVIVINNGLIALDGPKDEVFAKLSAGPGQRVQKIA